LVVTWNVEHSYLTDGHFLPDKVDVELYVLGASVVNRILGHVDHGHIVTVNDGGLLDTMMKLGE
jgi:hypothetical protein